VFSRTIGQNDLGMLYASLLGLGMTTDLASLKWEGQNCSNLAWDNLATLQVWVDKENSIELSFIHVYYLYNYYMVCASISCNHMTF